MTQNEIADIIQKDIGNRGIRNILPDDNYQEFQLAAKKLVDSSKVAILSGFACIMDSEPHYETDGIAGAFAIAKCLLNMNKQVTLLFDAHSEPYMKEIIQLYLQDMNTSLKGNLDSMFLECGHNNLSSDSLQKLQIISETFDAIVSIERPSITISEKYLTMSAFDISHLSSAFDKHLFPLVGEKKKNSNQHLISIGDGGNEVGMGKVQKLVIQHINNGEKIAANTYCDNLIVSDTSNFGGYALVYFVILGLVKMKLDSSQHKQLISLFPQFMQPLVKDIALVKDFKDLMLTQIGVMVSNEKACARLLEKYGIKDGITKQVGTTVDGISFDDQAVIIFEMQKVLDNLFAD
ncbi:UNKNOWN [Stylonychia lemnae]|uniref:D-glutamate cyclase-like C-terminal domain-containing protein n=1 Tax=Stylonychia lemnae TaxID=5949 RepID=A0A078BDY3_STYLE|nr:UNKNOWN [Stylonychia lemnae]|eukprot:CDW91788.1 UNKNOWN [Stylonychia lemnae]